MDAFQDSGTETLHVPGVFINKYLDKEPWSSYFKNIVIIPNYFGKSNCEKRIKKELPHGKDVI